VMEKAGKSAVGSVVRLYEGQDWAILADRMPDPKLYLSLRGGSTQVPHSHLDLMSFHCVVNGERLIENLSPDGYLDTTFSTRRNEIFEIGPTSKNTLLINGVGIASASACDRSEQVCIGGHRGIRLLTTSAMGLSRMGNDSAAHCRRTVLMLPGPALLIVDRVILPAAGCVENRLHSRAKVHPARAGALISGAKESLRVAYASTVPALLCAATTAPTEATASPATLLRWCTRTRFETEVCFGTLLTPGRGPSSISIEEEKRRLVIHIACGKERRVIRIEK
ncbi:MAG: heparinase II/III family protein, partial [Planctomycetes bacterium]|nr:heparinase II/III family protein [Planctomycetota bacterium]